MSDLYFLLCLFFLTFQVKHPTINSVVYANNFANHCKTKNLLGSLKSQPQDSFDTKSKGNVFPVQFLVQYMGPCDLKKSTNTINYPVIPHY